MWKVYCYKNKCNGKRYVGVTKKKLSNRAGKNGSEYIRKNKIFGQAIKDYGWENFEVKVLFETEDEQEGSSKEKYYIKLFNTTSLDYGYNGNIGGCIPTQKKVVQYSKDKEYIRTFSSPKEASDFVGITTDLVVQCCRGVIKTAGNYIWRYEKFKDDRMEEYYIVPFSGERKVTQISLKGQVLNVFDSAKEAEEETGACRSKICMCCKGQRKTAGGFRWEYTDGFGLKDIYNPVPSKIKMVVQFDLNSNFIAKYASQNEAHRQTGFSASMIGECCRGIRKTACGYIWKYQN